MSYVIGIAKGTSVIKAVVFDAAGRTCGPKRADGTWDFTALEASAKAVPRGRRHDAALCQRQRRADAVL